MIAPWTGRHSSQVVVIVIVAAAFSLVVGWYQLLGMRELHQYLEYDDGVWFGTSVRLAHGIFPYRSFVDDQPPGVPVAMLPFGLSSRWVGTRAAFAAARLAVPVVETIGILALGWVVRHRSALTVAIACGAMAVYPASLIDQRTVMLEPFCSTLCLLGLASVFEADRLSARTGRLAVAGACFGLAGSCKAFAVLPFAVIALALLASSARRRLTPFLAGTVGGFALVCGPFFFSAPGAFLHDVIVAQLTRADNTGYSVYDRLVSLIGSPPSLVPAPTPDHGQRALAVVLAIAIGVLVVGSYTVGTRARRVQGRNHGPDHAGRPAPLDAVAVLTVVVTGAAMAVPAAYYYHYAAFFGPFLALMLGLAGGRLVPPSSGHGIGRRPLRLPSMVFVLCTATVLLAGAVEAVKTVQASPGGYPDVSLIDTLVPAGACVLGDDAPSLLLADRFSSATPGCTAVTDAFGTTLSSDGGYTADLVEATAPGTVGIWLEALEHSDYVVLVLSYQERRIPWEVPALRRYVSKDFKEIQAAGYVILRRKGIHPARPPGTRAGAPAAPVRRAATGGGRSDPLVGRRVG